MVVAAEQGHAVQVGGSAPRPGGDVVGVAPLRWRVAARHHTATVADGEGAFLVAGGEPVGVAVVQDRAVGVQQQPRSETSPPPHPAAPPAPHPAARPAHAPRPASRHAPRRPTDSTAEDSPTVPRRRTRNPAAPPPDAPTRT